MRFIQIRTESAPLFVNTGNILYVTTREYGGNMVPVLIMVTGSMLQAGQNTLEEIMEMLEAPDGGRTEIPESILQSFQEMWEEDGDTEEVGEQDNTPPSGTWSPQVDTEDEDPVIYRDGDEDPRSDDDLLPA